MTIYGMKRRKKSISLTNLSSRSQGDFTIISFYIYSSLVPHSGFNNNYKFQEKNYNNVLFQELQYILPSCSDKLRLISNLRIFLFCHHMIRIMKQQQIYHTAVTNTAQWTPLPCNRVITVFICVLEINNAACFFSSNVGKSAREAYNGASDKDVSGA